MELVAAEIRRVPGGGRSGLAIAAAIFLAYAVVAHLGALHPEKIAASAAGPASTIWVFTWPARCIGSRSIADGGIHLRWFVFRKFECCWAATGCGGGGPGLHRASCDCAGGAVSLAITVLGSVGVFLGGAIWSWLYLRYRSVWPCYLSHAIADAAIFIIGYRLIFGGG